MFSRPVVHITQDFPPCNTGGISTAVGGMVRALQRAGVPCAVVSFDSARAPSSQPVLVEEDAGGLTILRVRNRSATHKALEVCYDLQAAIVHVHHERLWRFGTEVAAKTGAKTAYTVHVLQAVQNQLRGIDSTTSSDAQEQALRECDAILCPSERIATLLRNNEAYRDRIHTTPLGYESWPMAEVARNLPRPTDAPVVLFAGRFADINGFFEFQEALLPLFSRFPPLTAAAAGGLPSNQRSQRRWQERWTKRAGSANLRLTFTGWLDKEQLSSWYARATILVVPSWFETFGQVALEGALHRTPLVATTAGGLGDFINDTTATVIAPQQVTDLVEGVSATLANPHEANRKAEAMLTQVVDKYTWQSRIWDLVDVYQELIAHEKRPTGKAGQPQP